MQRIKIENTERHALAALAFLSGGSRFIIIICHGFRGVKENSGKLYAFADRLQELGAGVYAFDFWGSGESDGEFAHMTLTSQARDLAGVIDYVF
ncbi:MAG: alpha/beta hydrolase, partial [Syntrophomonas sp.]